MNLEGITQGESSQRPQTAWFPLREVPRTGKFTEQKAEAAGAGGGGRGSDRKACSVLVKNPPAMQEAPVPFLDQEDPLEKGWTTHCSVLAWRTPTDRGAWRATVHGVTKSRTRLSN